MRLSKRICAISIAIVISILCNNSFAQDQKKVKPWTGTLKDGTKINAEDLRKLITDHKKWLGTDGKEGKRAILENANLSEANLQRAILENANLSGANLQRAYLWIANLQRAILENANLRSASLYGANLQNAYLMETNLQEADLTAANLEKAHLERANLKNANLSGANLQNANLMETNLKDANLSGANLGYALLELSTDGLPNITSVANADGLPHLCYRGSPHSLVELREAFKKAGLRKQEREITYAIKHTQTNGLLGRSEIEVNPRKAAPSISDMIEGIFVLVLFEWTCSWGMSPGRPLMILLILIFPFSLSYMLSLVSKNQKDGIWKHWIKDRSRKDLPFQVKINQPTWRNGLSEGPLPELLHRKNIFYALWFGPYFSILSAFHIGWRDLNVGNWIARIQPQEYTLRASGWVRLLSGIQSIISVYLLALWILTYFGRPFEGY